MVLEHPSSPLHANLHSSVRICVQEITAVVCLWKAKIHLGRDCQPDCRGLQQDAGVEHVPGADDHHAPPDTAHGLLFMDLPQLLSPDR